MKKFLGFVGILGLLGFGGANFAFCGTVTETGTDTVFVTVQEEIPILDKQSVRVYPNPAKDGWAKFCYTLAIPANVTIMVYTIMGDLVWEGNYNDSAGGIIHDWNCTNSGGEKIASNLYIYRITSTDNGNREETVTKKLIVIQNN
ncbi:MAG: T9SS type A sorting domain-containing protein, partial [Candidatus Kuenenbacteria bacterium]